MEPEELSDQGSVGSEEVFRRRAARVMRTLITLVRSAQGSLEDKFDILDERMIIEIVASGSKYRVIDRRCLRAW